MRRTLVAMLFFLLCKASAPAQATTVGTQIASPRGQFDPVNFGADLKGSSDSTKALQATLDAAGKLMGGIVQLPPGTYKISSPISVPNGVILRGSGAFASYGGTIIQNTGSGPAIKLQSMSGGNTAGSGRFMEISDLTIKGSGHDDDCIDLLAAPKSSPQMYRIYRTTCSGFGGRGIYMNGSSYGVIDEVSLSSTTATGACLDIEGGTALSYTEVSYFSKINTQKCSPGVKIMQANNLYFHEMDLNDNLTGVYISGKTFNIYFSNTNIVRSTNSGVELYASGAYLGRIRFSNTTIQSGPNSSASAHYVYAHSDPGFKVFNIDFNGLDLSRGGSTPLSAGISADASSCVSFVQVRNGSNDGASIANPCAYSTAGAFNSQEGYQLNGASVISGKGVGAFSAVTGPAKAPTGRCSAAGQWVFSQDGHATFCNGSSWVPKI